MAPIKDKHRQPKRQRPKIIETKRPGGAKHPEDLPLTDAAAQRQKLNKGGLLITNELDIAIQTCKSKVERIAAECRRGNRKFRDIEFDLIEDRDCCLHALSPSKPRYEPSDVLRVTQIFENPQFFVDGATASDIQQGALGDCWFLSAVVVVAAAGLIEKVCVARDEKVGIYGFIFWRDGGWVNVIIDDVLPTRVPQWEALNYKEQTLYRFDRDFYNKTARRGGKSLYFARSLTENETWVPLLEKAYAKLHGDYASLDGGLTNEAIEDLTGAVSHMIYVKDILDVDQFWNEQLTRVNHDRLFGCFTPNSDFNSDSGPDSLPEVNGLLKSHAYSVTKAVEYRGKRFLRVRNPWGKHEWTGRWSDGSKEWTGEWLDALKALDHSFGNDGEFVMEYSDFLEAWGAIEVSHLFDSSWAMSQRWLKVNAGDTPKAWNFGDVSYTISVPNPTHAVIVLAQLDWRFFEELRGHSMWSFDFVLYKKGEEEECASSIYSTLWDRSVKMEVDLDAGDYVVHVRLDRALFRERGYSQKADEWGIRKYSRKRAEYLLSNSIALNFRPRDYGPTLPLSRDIYTGKHDLTELELSMHESLAEHKSKALEAFAPKPSTEEGHTDAAGDEKGDGDEDWATDEADDGAGDEETPGDKLGGGPAGIALKVGEGEVLPKKFDLDMHPGGDKDKDKDKDKEKETEGDKEQGEGGGKGEDQGKDKDEEKGKEDGDGKETNQEEHATEGGSGDAPEQEEEGPGNGGPPPESRFFCDGCRDNIVGVRYHCLDAACPDYDLCGNCIQAGAHVEDHKFITIASSKDDHVLEEDSEDMPDNNSVVLGLRVYTNKESPATIKGQLRHASVVRNALTYPKII